MSSPIQAKIEDAQQNKHEESPVVVRSLKEPPEIWDLVHETPAHFDPTGAFVNRLTTSKRTAVLVLVSVLLVVGLAAFAIMKLTNVRMPGASAMQRQLEGATTTSQPATNATTSREPITSVVAAPSSTSPAPESVVNNTVPESTQPQPTAAQSTGSTVVSPPLAEGMSNESAGVMMTDTSRRVASRRPGVRSTNKQVTVLPGSQNDVQSADNRATGAGRVTRTDPANDSTEKPELQRSNDKTTNDSSRTGANPTLSPQLIAPPAASPSPKAKVIQWP
jgi:hypothetical protein